MPNSDLVRLRHILDAAREAVAFCHTRSRQDLDTDRMFYHCLIRLLEVVGEAARAVSRSFRDAHPDIAWRRMVGMRDRLSHGYFDINRDILWQTATEDLPALIREVERAAEPPQP